MAFADRPLTAGELKVELAFAAYRLSASRAVRLAEMPGAATRDLEVAEAVKIATFERFSNLFDALDHAEDEPRRIAAKELACIRAYAFGAFGFAMLLGWIGIICPSLLPNSPASGVALFGTAAITAVTAFVITKMLFTSSDGATLPPPSDSPGATAPSAPGHIDRLAA